MLQADDIILNVDSLLIMSGTDDIIAFSRVSRLASQNHLA